MKIMEDILFMVKRIKRAFTALILAMMLFLAACAPQVQEQAGAVPGAAITPGEENLAPGNAKGRYMESPFDPELPEGVIGLSVLGIGAIEGAVEIFSMNSDAWETENPTFYRHTFKADGAQAFQEEPWLNEHLKLGNEMQVVRGGDGALYPDSVGRASGARQKRFVRYAGRIGSFRSLAR